MKRTRRNKPLNWSAFGFWLLLAGLVVVGLVANGLSPWQVPVALAFIAAILLVAWLMQITLRQRPSQQPWTVGDVLWQAVVFACCLAVISLAVWWLW